MAQLSDVKGDGHLDYLSLGHNRKERTTTRMVAQEFLSQLDKLHFVDSANLHDFADRCAYLLSFIILLMCFTIVTLKSYVFEPFSCYTATTFSGSNMIAYINAFCWVNGTVPADVNTNRLEDPVYWDYLESRKLNYYQWVSLVLALQAILCYLPSLIWEGLTFNRVGTNINFYIEFAQSAAKETGINRKNRVQFLASALDTLFFARRPLAHRPHSSICYRAADFFGDFLPRKRMGRALCAYYLVIKLLYFTNAVFQIVIMERFLGMPDSHKLFGVQILLDLWYGRYWQQTLIFPRVGYCRVPIKLVGRTVPTLIAQCTMPVNMLSEKVYIFLWFWFVGVATLQAISIITWTMRLSLRKRRVKALIHYLKIAEAYDQGMRETLKRFESTCLRPDGTFLLYMMRLNAGDIVTNELIQALFERYIRHEKLADASPVKEGGPALVSSPTPSVDVKGDEGSVLKHRFV
ncbi:Innexin unc-9 [Taenia solium]|eukprot:TsM_000557300 transcript=TsM_000557300 gene=TsM_000557300